MIDNIRLSFAALWSNKVRALLTMLGIIIGIGSVIAIVTVGDSLTGSITSSMQDMGANNITVRVQNKEDTERNFSTGTMSEDDLISSDMIDELLTAYPNEIEVVSLTKSVQTAGEVTDASNTAYVSAMGVDENYEIVEQVVMQYGRFINDTDDERALAVVSDEFCNALFGYSNTTLIGEEFTLNLTTGGVANLYIIGIYQYEDDGMSMGDTSTDITSNIYLPMEYAEKVSYSDDGYQSFTAVTTTGTDNTAFVEDIETFFDFYYVSNETYEVGASTMESMMESMTEMLGSVQLAIAAIAAISLLVGGIGVMNIMMVSITERTKEIGTRKALGATNGKIRVQFVTEAVVICLVGGIIGVAVGVGLGAFGANLLGYAAQPSVIAIVLAVGFSMFIGVFFGYYPAQKAAKLNPIDALRYE